MKIGDCVRVINLTSEHKDRLGIIHRLYHCKRGNCYHLLITDGEEREKYNIYGAFYDEDVELVQSGR